MTASARLAVAAVGLVVGVALVRATVVSPYVVESDSMTPTVGEGAVVLVDKVSTSWDPVERDDLVVFATDDGLALKRVVGVAGDVVAIRDAVTYLNGARVREPYVDRASIDATYWGPVKVPNGHVLVLGDQRESSIDSRWYGPVPIGDIRGKVVAEWRDWHLRSPD